MTSNMIINDNIKLKIKELSINANTEQCGIIVDNQAILLRNINPEAENNFTISPADIDLYGWENVQAIWHTHIKDIHPGEFTYTDLILAHQSQKPIILYHTIFKVWDYYEPNNPNPYLLKNTEFDKKNLESYLNIKFEWGRSDCFAIVRRYLLGVCGVDIGEFTRPAVENFPTADYKCPWDMSKFNLLPLGTQPELHDVFGIALFGGKNVNHAAILVKPEENIIFHSISDKEKSKLETYHDYWRKRTLLHGRLKELC